MVAACWRADAVPAATSGENGAEPLRRESDDRGGVAPGGIAGVELREVE